MSAGLIAIAMGLAFAGSAGVEWVRWSRARHRLVRTTGVVVHLVDRMVADPGTKSRAPVFRFTTGDGRVVEVTSRTSTWPGPKIGKELTVVYDPQDPDGTAERIGAWKVKQVLLPLAVVGGLAGKQGRE
jgi:hypothetical protein